MKIKYKLQGKKHFTHIVVSNFTLKQVEALINYLELNNLDFEYVGSNQ